MKHLLLSSIIAMLAVPAFATTPTTLPNNALCNETNLGTESGSADIEVVWTPNTITTQWYTGYGENNVYSSPTTCRYNDTINLPATNPSRAGYAFAGWKLRASQCIIPATDINTAPLVGYAHERSYCYNYDGGNIEHINCLTVSDLSLNEWKVTWSNGDVVNGIASCQATLPSDIMYYVANIESVMAGEMDPNTFLSEYTAIAGVQKGAITQQALQTYLENNIDEAYRIAYGQLLTLPGNSNFTTSDTGAYCLCKPTHYTANNAQQCSLLSYDWQFLVHYTGGSDDCSASCAGNCMESLIYRNWFRSAMFGQE